MPKTTLRFHRTHGTHGSCLIKAYGLLQWLIQIKISQERWHNRTESKRDHIASFQLPPATPLQSDIDIWQCTSSIANRERHASLGVVQVFWVSVTQTRGTCVTDLLLSSFSKCQTGIESVSLPVSQYSININFSAQHKAPGKQTLLLSQICQVLRGYLPGVGQVSARHFFGMKRLHNSGLYVFLYAGQVKIFKTHAVPILLHFNIIRVLKVKVTW